MQQMRQSYRAPYSFQSIFSASATLLGAALVLLALLLSGCATPIRTPLGQDRYGGMLRPLPCQNFHCNAHAMKVYRAICRCEYEDTVFELSAEILVAEVLDPRRRGR